MLTSEFQRASASDATVREKRRCGRRQGLGRCSDISMETVGEGFVLERHHLCVLVKDASEVHAFASKKNIENIGRIQCTET